jgi:putative ABC transport system permease protein
MKLQKSLRFALNMLLHSKLRSWLTIIGIVIGVGAIIAIVSLGEGLQASVSSQLGGLGADLITVSPGFSRAQGFGGGGGDNNQVSTLTDETYIGRKDLQMIKSVPGIAFVNPTISGSADITYLGEKTKVSIQGVDESVWKHFITTELESGRYLSAADSNVIVISYGLAHNIFENEIYVNKPVVINDNLFRVVGVLEEGGFGGGNTVYMPIFSARSILNDKVADRYDSISVKVSNVDDLDLVSAAITEKLRIVRHVTDRTQDFTIISSRDTQRQVQDVLGTFTLFLSAIAAVSLIVGAVGVANTMFTSVLEKTKDIGILKAIGARNEDILTIFLLNSGLVGLVGGILGVMLGWLISFIFPLLIPAGPGGQSIQPVVTPSIVIISLLGAIAVGMIAGAIPARRGSKLKPVDALRYE